MKQEVLSQTPQAVAPKKKIPVIIDTDPGVDDVIAILLALASPELDVRAIIITFGNTDVDAAYLNVLKIYNAVYKLFDSDFTSRAQFCNVAEGKIILARGSDVPLEGDLHSAQYFHGRDGLAGITERHPDLNVPYKIEESKYPGLTFTGRAGVDVAYDILKGEAPRSLTYLVLGPMTTLAHLCRNHADTVNERIGRVICMGGALDVPGNTGPVAEFNFFADPYAVRELLVPESGTPALPLNRFLLVPLDTTTPHELPFPYYASTIDPSFHSTKTPSVPEGKSPVVHFTSAFLEKTREVMLTFGKDAMELHDIVVVWCAIDNPPEKDEITNNVAHIPTLINGWGAVHRKFDVERIGELTRGMLVVDRREGEGAYDPGANRAKVQAELEKHNFNTSAVFESNALPAQVELEAEPSATKESDGVPVVTTTPGPAALLKLLARRVWGIESD
ncbi:hypothetical protein NM688_g6249 [Phlebia brevispora]|uniref:Uncharacterized protein n=1 Tax=Phlebia brevispora TaxID=194682 RepID=A0ACC1SI61_9APHY|nr:hypothetical protein NM688_g6249 [Phlebia brevispora]